MSLIERLRLAQGPSRELDAEIAKMVGAPHGPWEHVTVETRSISYVDEQAPAYTASLDAAMTLVPEGWRWEDMERDVSWDEAASMEQSYGVGLDLRDSDGRYLRNAVGSHDALPLALCLAALLARGIEG